LKPIPLKHNNNVTENHSTNVTLGNMRSCLRESSELYVFKKNKKKLYLYLPSFKFLRTSCYVYIIILILISVKVEMVVKGQRID
jgi:hypothetical protein